MDSLERGQSNSIADYLSNDQINLALPLGYSPSLPIAVLRKRFVIPTRPPVIKRWIDEDRIEFVRHRGRETYIRNGKRLLCTESRDRSKDREKLNLVVKAEGFPAKEPPFHGSFQLLSSWKRVPRYNVDEATRGNLESSAVTWKNIPPL